MQKSAEADDRVLIVHGAHECNTRNYLFFAYEYELSNNSADGCKGRHL